MATARVGGVVAESLITCVVIATVVARRADGRRAFAAADAEQKADCQSKSSE
jgi:hypothetical protein